MQSIETVEVVLESQADLARLLMEWQPRMARRRPHADLPVEAIAGSSTGRISRQRNCACGSCRRCVENARWERIFNEKFADRGYYGRIAVRHNSSLAAI